jgi:hypothetical protein
MKNIILTLGMIAMVFCLNTDALSSNYADTFGFSAKGISLGNSMVANVDDWSSVYYNVAGLGRTPHFDMEKPEKENSHSNQIAINYLYSSPDFNLDISRFDIDSDGNITPLETSADKSLNTSTLIVGLTVDIDDRVFELPAFISTARFGLGVGIPSDLSAAKLNDLDPRTHNFLRYGRETEKIFLLAGLGTGFFKDVFGIGVGINASFEGDGTVLVEEVEFDISRQQTPKGQAKMDLKIKPSPVFGFYFSPGKIFSVLDGLDVGLAYRAESEMEIDPFDTTAVTNVGNISLRLVLSLLDYYQPEIITAGISKIIMNGKMTVSVDIEHQKWSDYKVSTAIEKNWADQLPDLSDIVVTKLGMQLNMTKRTTLLFGYYYQPSFIPDHETTGVVNYLENDKHVISFGGQFTMPKKGILRGPIQFTVGYQLQKLVERDVIKADPTGVNPNYSYGGYCHSVVAGFTY